MAETLINTNQIDGSIGGAKALNIAVVGNPTISDDFIVSGFSQNDYLVYPQPSPRTYSVGITGSRATWKVKMKFRFTQLVSGGNSITDSPVDQDHFRFGLNSSHKLQFLVAANGWINAGGDSDYQTDVEYTTMNEWWWIEAGYDSDGHLYINRSLDGENFTNVWKNNNVYDVSSFDWRYYPQVIGFSSSTYLEFDLKEFKFYSGDILTYSAVKDAE